MPTAWLSRNRVSPDCTTYRTQLAGVALHVPETGIKVKVNVGVMVLVIVMVKVGVGSGGRAK